MYKQYYLVMNSVQLYFQKISH